MARAKRCDNSKTFTIDLGLKLNKNQIKILKKRFEVAHRIDIEMTKFARNSLNAYKNDGNTKKM